MRGGVTGLVVFFLCTAHAWGASDDVDVVTPAPHGKVNWSSRVITATGSGPPSLKAPNVAVARLGAERAAKADAVRSIIDVVRLLVVSGKMTASTPLDKTADLKARVEAVVKDFKTLDTRYFADGGVELVVECPLDGALAQLFLDSPGKTPSGDAPAPADQTGVVINAKGLKAAASLNPRLVDETGLEVYAASVVLSDALLTRGTAGYTKSLDGALKDARVTDKPLIVRALRLAESGPGDLVIATADAVKLEALKPVLSQAKVIIVLD